MRYNAVITEETFAAEQEGAMTDRIYLEYGSGGERDLPLGSSTVEALSAALEPVDDGMELAWVYRRWRYNMPEEDGVRRFCTGLRVVKGWFCPENVSRARRAAGTAIPWHVGFSVRKVGTHCRRVLALCTNWGTNRFSEPLQTVGDLKAYLRRSPRHAPVIAPDGDHTGSRDYRVSLFFGQDVRGKEYLFLQTFFPVDDDFVWDLDEADEYPDIGQ